MTRRRKEGIALLPVVTGVVVALGTLLLLSGLIGGLLVAVDALPLEGNEVAEIGALGSIGLLVVLFAAYLWGGYTAGRMARTSGTRLGLLVAAVALGVSALAAVAADSVDLEANLTVPFTSDRLPIEEDVAVDWDSGLGLLGLIAMVAGGAVGGAAGAAWHSRIDSRSQDAEERPEEPPIDGPEGSGEHDLGGREPSDEAPSEDPSAPRYR